MTRRCHHNRRLRIPVMVIGYFVGKKYWLHELMPKQWQKVPWRSVMLCNYRRHFWKQETSFFFASVFRPVWPGRCIWALSVYRSRLAPWTRGESNHGKLSALRPLGHGRYRFATASAFWKQETSYRSPRRHDIVTSLCKRTMKRRKKFKARASDVLLVRRAHGPTPPLHFLRLRQCLMRVRPSFHVGS